MWVHLWEVINALFWATGALVWSIVLGCFLLLLYGELRFRADAERRFRKKYMTKDEYAMFYGLERREVVDEKPTVQKTEVTPVGQQVQP